MRLKINDIELGRNYRDTVTGIIGTATAVISYYMADVQVMLERVVDGENKCLWVTIGRVEEA